MRSIYTILSLLLCMTELSTAQNYADSAVSCLTEYQKLSEKKDTQLWGISMDVPVIIVDREHQVLYLDRPSGDPNEAKYENVFILPLDTTSELIEPVSTWHGQKCVVMDLSRSSGRKELMAFIAHESFHCVQDQLGIEASNPSLPHLSTIQGRTLMQVELMELLKAMEQENLELKTNHIKNALCLRTIRYRNFKDARPVEGKTEMNEGLAQYTGLTRAGYSGEALLNEYRIAIRNFQHIQNEAGYPYYSGSLYAFLNDQSGKHWKKHLPKTYLHEITASVYGIDAEKTAEHVVDELLLKDEYKDISSLFMANSVEELTALFSTNILKLPLKEIQVQFRSNLVVSIPDKGTVYNNIVVTGDWGRLNVTREGRVLISKDAIVLNADSMKAGDKHVKGENWILEMNDDWEISVNEDGQYLEKHN